MILKVHNDFASYNAHVFRAGLYVTDFSEMPLGVLDECAGFFWAALEISKLHPLLSGSALTRCQCAFEEGYGKPLSVYWKTWGLLRQLSYLNAPSSSSPLLRIWRRWRAAGIERWLARVL